MRKILKIGFYGLIIFIMFLFTQTVLISDYKQFLPIICVQPNGDTLKCFVSGDEYYHWLHDKDGFTIVQAENGYYVYAIQDGDDLKPTSFVVGKENPYNLRIEKWIKISPLKIQEKIENFYPKRKEKSDGILRRTGPENMPRTGTVNNIVIFIKFLRFLLDPIEISGTPDFYQNKFNATSGISLKSYFSEVSYRSLVINSHFFPVPGVNINEVTIPHERGYYEPFSIFNMIGYKNDNERWNREKDLVQTALNQAYIPDNLDIDADGNNTIDMITLIFSGNRNHHDEILWAHRTSWPSSGLLFPHNGKNLKCDSWIILSENEGLGTFCHETFHNMGSSDLYRYSNQFFNPVGPWDIMQDSHQNPPQHMSAYMKYEYGNWINDIPLQNTSGTKNLNALTSSSNNCLRVNSPFSLNEYFVLEYRRNLGTGYESRLPGSGLLIYKINENVSVDDGNKNGPPDRVYIYRPGGTNGNTDGNINAANFSQDVNRRRFNKFTNPSPFLNNNTWGGLSISEIGNAGNTISFKINIVNANCKGATSIAITSYLPCSIPNIQRTLRTVSYSSLSWPQNTSFLIEIEATDDVGVNSATLFYKQRNSSSYSSSAMSNMGGGIWRGSIPGSFSQQPGVDYYITATDGANNVSLPSSEPQQFPFQIAILPNLPPQISLLNNPCLTSFNLYQNLRIIIFAKDNTNSLSKLKLYFRRAGELLYQSLNFLNMPIADKKKDSPQGNPDEYYADIPAEYVTEDGLDFFVYAEDDFGVGSYSGTNDDPIIVNFVTYNPSITISYEGNDPNGACPYSDITFTGEGNEGIVTWQWDFGDGSPLGFGKTMHHTYCQPGNYDITLTVFGPNGEMEQTSKSLTVKSSGCPLRVHLTNKEVCKGESIELGSKAICNGHELQTTVTGGSGSYDFRWYPNTALKNSNTGNPTLLTSYSSSNYTLLVTDYQTGEQATGTMTLTVIEPLSVSLPTSYTIKKGNSVSIGTKLTVKPDDEYFSCFWTDKNGWTSSEINPSVSPTVTTRYYLTVTDINNCKSLEKSLLVKVTSRKGSSDSEFASEEKYNIDIYPNPSKDIFNIEASFEKPLKAEIKLTNLLGEDIYYEKIDETDYIHQQIDLSEFPKGVYFIRVYFNNEVLVEKIIKE